MQIGLNSLNKSNTYVYTDSLSWTKGQHQFKFGGDIRRLGAMTPLEFQWLR